MREVCLFTGNYETQTFIFKRFRLLSESVEHDGRQAEVVLHVKPRGFYKKTMWLKICPSYNYLGLSIMHNWEVFV